MKVLLLPLLLCTFVSVSAQPSSRFRIGVESGVLSLTGEIDDRWEFRQPKSHHTSYENYYENFFGEGEIIYFALKTEYSLPHKRFTITSGLRYNMINERISSPSSSSHLLLFRPSDQGIDLYRIYGIEETLGYLTIPLELEILLWGYHSRWQGYVKGGIQAGIKVYGNTQPDFVSKEIAKHKEDILAGIGEAPSSFFSNVYASFGIRFIIRNKVSLALENTTPHIFLTKNNFSLLSSYTLPGLQLKASIPINIRPIK